MNTLKKCPNCKSHTISIMDVAQLMIGVESIRCHSCQSEIELSIQAKKTRQLFWMIEIAMYSILIYFSFYFRSWSVFAWGLCITMIVEISMLYLKPLTTKDGEGFIEKEL